MAVLITEVEASAAVVAKINQKHGFTMDDVLDAIESHDRTAGWETDSDRGLRLLVRGVALDGRVVRAILYPVSIEQGTFRLGTAFEG